MNFRLTVVVHQVEHLTAEEGAPPENEQDLGHLAVPLADLLLLGVRPAQVEGHEPQQDDDDGHDTVDDEVKEVAAREVEAFSALQGIGEAEILRGFYDNGHYIMVVINSYLYVWHPL